MKGRSALTLGDRLEIEAALDAAFAPLRERRTDLSPLRVRAAVRWGRGVDRSELPAAVRWSGAIRRLSELSVAVGMSVVIFGGALGPALPPEARDASASAGPLRGSALPLEQQQQDILRTKHEWLEALRARLEAIRSAAVQDLLDPTVPRPVLLRVRADLPTPRVDNADRSGPY